ncbi:hypothetical protein MMPV_002491 [Pyropia vietnamensis]
MPGHPPSLAAALASVPHVSLSGERWGGLPAALSRMLAALQGRPPPPAPPRAAVAIVLRLATPIPAARGVSKAGPPEAGGPPPPAPSAPPVTESQLVDMEVLLIQRTARVGDPWSGHLAFPGGRVEAGEGDEEAAARETAEEVGLDLRTGAWVCLGHLDDVSLRPRRSRRSLAVLAAVVWAHMGGEAGIPIPPLRLCAAEVDATLWLPLRSLLAPGGVMPAGRRGRQRLMRWLPASVVWATGGGRAERTGWAAASVAASTLAASTGSDGGGGGRGGTGHDGAGDGGDGNGGMADGWHVPASPPWPVPPGIAIAHPAVDAFASAEVTYRPGAPAAAVAARPLLWGLTLNALLRLVAVAGGGVGAAVGTDSSSGGIGGGPEREGAPPGGRLFAGHALVPPVAVDHPVVAALLWRLPRPVGEWVLGLR